jgi:cell division protein FtsB
MVALAVVYVDWRDLPGLYSEVEASRARVLDITHEVERLKEEKASLERRVEQLRSSSVEMEAQVRRSKGMVRPGEIIYVVE